MTERYRWRCAEAHSHDLRYLWKGRSDSLTYHLQDKIVSLQSPLFTSGSGNDKLKWYLSLNRSRFDYESYFSLYLCLDVCKTPNLQGKIKFSLLNHNDEETNIMVLEKLSFTQPSGFGFPKFIKQDDLFVLSNTYCRGRTLRILCEGSIRVCVDYNIPNNPVCKLLEDLRNLFESGRFSDVTFLVSNQEIKAHKNILAARSEAFAVMFSHEMEEQRTNRVVISDIDHDVFKEMLFFIYTGQSPNLDKMANDLLVAADKYQLGKLKAICEDAIVPKISVDKAVEILLLADRHSADQLKKRAIKFITRNTSKVMQTKDWKKLTTAHMHLIMENLCKITHK